MVNKGIRVLDHYDLFFKITLINEPILDIFRFKQNKFISTDELSRVLGHKYTLPCFQLTYKTDIRITKQRILERRQNNVMDGNTVKTEPSTKKGLMHVCNNNSVVIKHILLIIFYFIAQASDQNDSSSNARDPSFPTTINFNNKLLF